MKVHFLLPAYNEAENIARQITRLIGLAEQAKVDYRIYVVDDGSSDDTAACVQEIADSNNQVLLARHEKNSGPGAAFKTGFEVIFAQADDDDLIISMDADNTHSEGTIRMMLARAADGYEVIIASVFARGGMLIGLPFFRYVLTLSSNFIYRVLFPVSGIREYTGFYRAYRVGALRKAFKQFDAQGESMLTCNGFATAAELLIKLRRIPLFMTEVPMMVRYDQKGGKSKMRIVATTMEHLRLIGSNVWRRRIF